MSNGQNRRGEPQSKHTSIIYFHGMGQPRRYEEISRLIDSLDRFVSTDDSSRLGALRGQKLGVEPARHGDERDNEPIVFFAFRRFILRADRKTAPAGDYRLYESYWSPAAAGAAAALRVLIWLLGRTIHPLSVLSRPWRAHQRLKRTYLYGMFYDRGRMPALRYRQLAALYREFEGMEARRKYPVGDFVDFQNYVADRYGSSPRARADLLALARRWHGTLVRGQLMLLLVAISAIAAAAGMVAAIVYLVAFILFATGLNTTHVIGLVERAGNIPPWLSGLCVAGVLVGLLSISRFLRLYLSDVVFWTTTIEKDVRHRKRKEIVKAAQDTVRHVLLDPGCERIVIVSHSLGTAIAYETLITLGRRWRADRDAGINPSAYEALAKVSHFISLGSPIDRISYFFHATFSRYHRYNRVADELMGRSSDLPFKDDGRPIIQWINIRDPADPIASRLFSPRGPLPNRDQIREVEIASGHFPGPAAAHIGYFDSRLVSKVLFDAAILGRDSLQLQAYRPSWSIYLAALLHRSVPVMAAVFCWAVAGGGLGYMFGAPGLIWTAQLVGLASGGLIAFGWGLGALADRLHNLRLPA